MDYDSPDVAKDFPGLYASEAAKKSNESDFSDGDHDKLSKKDLLIGRKKDHKKDRGYAALEGESSPEDDDNKTGAKLKKSKAFKFSTKNKEKREKSRDKFVEKEKEKDSKDDKDKKKDKDKKDKDRKDKKEKDKEKKDKKVKPHDETLDLGDVQPVFGVALELSVEHSKCHDNTGLPVIVRNCIDYLQEFGLSSDQLYKVDCSKTKLHHLKKLYNNHETVAMDEFDVSTACTLLKSYLKELPDPILTHELAPSFEEALSIQNSSKRANALLSLVEQLPAYNRTLLSWTILHFDDIVQHEQYNKFNAQNLSVLMSPILMMSYRLLMALLCHCKTLFPGLELSRYVPPLSSTTLILPDSTAEIMKELQKQESLLSQIHSEMNAGFVSTKREEQLWEVQRIITQLKRKLRSAEKKTENDKVLDEEHNTCQLNNKECETTTETSRKNSVKCVEDNITVSNNSQTIENTTYSQVASSKEVKLKEDDKLSIASTNATENDKTESNDQSYNSDDTEAQPEVVQTEDEPDNVLEKQELTCDEIQYVQMKIENAELLKFVTDLQSSINNERADIVKLRTQVANLQQPTEFEIVVPNYTNLEQAINSMIEENALLEQKRIKLIRALFEERKKCIDLKVELAMLNISGIC